MTAKDYFLSVLTASKQLRYYQQELERLKLAPLGKGVSYDKEGSCSGCSDPMTSVIDYVSLEEQLDEQTSELKATVNDAIKVIMSVGANVNSLAAGVLRAKYIDGKAVKQISYDLHISRSHCYDLERLGFEWIDYVGLKRAKLGLGKATE